MTFWALMARGGQYKMAMGAEKPSFSLNLEGRTIFRENNLRYFRSSKSHCDTATIV